MEQTGQCPRGGVGCDWIKKVKELKNIYAYPMGRDNSLVKAKKGGGGEVEVGKVLGKWGHLLLSTLKIFNKKIKYLGKTIFQVKEQLNLIILCNKVSFTINKSILRVYLHVSFTIYSP